MLVCFQRTGRNEHALLLDTAARKTKLVDFIFFRSLNTPALPSRNVE
jgi:hypothetical protein